MNLHFMNHFMKKYAQPTQQSSILLWLKTSRFLSSFSGLFLDKRLLKLTEGVLLLMIFGSNEDDINANVMFYFLLIKL